MRSRPSLVGPALVLVVAFGASACTGEDGDDGSQAAEELPVEVEGEVLDRRDGTEDGDDADASDEDADAPDADAPDDDAPDDDAPGDAASDDGDRTGGADATGPRAGAPRGAPDPAPAPPAPSRPTTDPSPSRTPAATPSPAPARTPTPAATPEPRTLSAGPAEPTGPVLSSDGTAWTETSSTSVEAGDEPPPLTVGMRSGEDTPQRQVRCQAALEAPSDRGLVARGTLTVSLRIVTADGTVQVVPRQRIELDVVLAAGQRRQLEVSPARTVDVAEVRQVSCVAELVD